MENCSNYYPQKPGNLRQPIRFIIVSHFKPKQINKFKTRFKAWIRKVHDSTDMQSGKAGEAVPRLVKQKFIKQLVIEEKCNFLKSTKITCFRCFNLCKLLYPIFSKFYFSIPEMCCSVSISMAILYQVFALLKSLKFAKWSNAKFWLTSRVIKYNAFFFFR